jgi:hypothetical protein
MAMPNATFDIFLLFEKWNCGVRIERMVGKHAIS